MPPGDALPFVATGLSQPCPGRVLRFMDVPVTLLTIPMSFIGSILHENKSYFRFAPPDFMAVLVCCCPSPRLSPTPSGLPLTAALVAKGSFLPDLDFIFKHPREIREPSHKGHTKETQTYNCKHKITSRFRR